ncbi:hypothetical protein CRYUN_Cryun13aG0139100 [Craigia yunnanensis]
MPFKDTASWNTMISGFAQKGVMGKARALFLAMPEKNSITWSAMISGFRVYAQHGAACNRAALVDTGVRYFDSMLKDYGVEARSDHYTCMVDLLCRAGKLVEAVDLIKRIPFKPYCTVFGTLLGACRIHKNLEMAEFAAENLLNLDPKSAAGDVQLANVYAAMNKSDHVARIRQSMKDNKVVKTPGYSWIELKSIVHEFRSGDKVHPELAFIHEKLNELEKKMKLAGYVPDLEFALHDVGEEQKKQFLLRHSEKLAILGS